eukprot:15282901-Alexandrium_andersonii.AAC.1
MALRMSEIKAHLDSNPDFILELASCLETTRTGPWGILQALGLPQHPALRAYRELRFRDAASG